MDRPAHQLTGNCWLLGAINSIVATGTGKSLLENHFKKDDEKHIFAIHLQEAENNGLPKPKGDGIYVFTEKEVLEMQNSNKGLSSGEGDVTALAMAVEQYLKESGETPGENGFYQEGGLSYRFFEIITGATAKEVNALQECDYGLQYEYRLKSDPLGSDSFEKILNMAKDANYAIVLSKNEPDEGGAHALSVVGTEGNYLLVQESNLSDVYKDVFELIPNSFPPTYKVSEDVFKQYIFGYSALRMK